MTNKIEQLWEQTTGISFPRHGKYSSAYPDHIKDFAAAIVKECARIDSEANNPDHEDGVTYNQTILEHFGIEE